MYQSLHLLFRWICLLPAFFLSNFALLPPAITKSHTMTFTPMADQELSPTPAGPFLGFLRDLGIFGEVSKCVKWIISVYFADHVCFYFWHISWRSDFMLHHYRFRDILCKKDGFWYCPWDFGVAFVRGLLLEGLQRDLGGSRTFRRCRFGDGTFRRWWSQMFHMKKVFLKYAF